MLTLSPVSGFFSRNIIYRSVQVERSDTLVRAPASQSTEPGC